MLAIVLFFPRRSFNEIDRVVLSVFSPFCNFFVFVSMFYGIMVLVVVWRHGRNGN